MKRIVVLISGRGSNMAAIARAVREVRREAAIVAVISHRPQAPGLDLARSLGLRTEVLDHRDFSTREAFDAALQRMIDRHAPDLVVLAGFMRILTAGFVQHFAGRLVNIHPSLLPAYPGLDTHARALQDGVREHGATVHHVTDALDGGPIIAQARVPVLAGDTVQSLAERVQAAEHELYPRAILQLLRVDA